MTYPERWWQSIHDPNKPDWEILPQDARAPEVIVSKRNELGLLSNLAPTPFLLDGVRYASIEALWQMMKLPENAQDERARWSWPCDREKMRGLSGLESKRLGDLASAVMKENGIAWVSYQGRQISYPENSRGPFYDLIRRAMTEKLRQNPEVSALLERTRGLTLRPDHTMTGTISPAHRYTEIWMELREQKSP